jgi:hypothetical protein
MNPNELRALADALSRQRQADEHGIYCAVPRQAVDAAIRHLRAQADAQPVAWTHIDGRVISAATMDQAYMDGGAMQSSLRDYTIPLYAHSAPAVPQAEPKREPLGDWRIDEEATNRQMTAACEDAFYDGVRWAEHSHGIGGSDAE